MNTSNISFPSFNQLRDLAEKVLANQQALNEKAYAQDWLVHAGTGNFDYALATGVELVEFANSWNKWCWWSKAEPDDMAQLNMKVEVVDALHFIVSDILYQYQASNPKDAELAIAIALNAVQMDMVVHRSDKDQDNYVKSRLKALLTYSGRPAPGTTDHAIQALSNLYQISIHACGLGFKQLVAMYLAKSTLNQFRQDNGYREKRYTKIWAQSTQHGPVEDNLVLMRWIAGQDTPPNKEQVYAYLTETYAKVVVQ